MSATLDLTARLEEPELRVPGLPALVAAAAVLERPRTDAGPDLVSEREKRKLAVYVRRFEAAAEPPKHKRAPKVKPAVEPAGSSAGSYGRSSPTRAGDRGCTRDRW